LHIWRQYGRARDIPKVSGVLARRLARRFRVGKWGKIKPGSPMYHFGFPCSHQGFASGGQPRGSRQDVLTTIMFAAWIGVFAYFSAAPPLDNHHHVEGVSAIIMIVPVVPDGSMKSAMPLEYQRHLLHV